MRVFAPAFRGHVGDGALQNLEQGLLYTLTRHVPGDGAAFTLAGDFVDLVDVDDAPLSLRHVHVCLLQEAQQNVFHVVSHIARFRESRGVRNGERHVEHLCQAARHQGFATARWPHEKNVGLFQLGTEKLLLFAVFTRPGQALVVVVNSHGKGFLGFVLANDKGIQVGLDVLGLGDTHQADGGATATGRKG